MVRDLVILYLNDFQKFESIFMLRALEAVFLVDLVYSSTIVISYVPISSVKRNEFLLFEPINSP